MLCIFSGFQHPGIIIPASYHLFSLRYGAKWAIISDTSPQIVKTVIIGLIFSDINYKSVNIFLIIVPLHETNVFNTITILVVKMW